MSPQETSRSARKNMTFDPDLRIPPLQNPVPLVHSDRPSPLEPNARVHEPPHHPKLTSRTKSLKSSKLDGDAGGNALYRVGSADNGMRKKQKVDIFQLPKPESKPRANKPPPFEPVRILTELHEPPPSAGLFPPITPSGLNETEPTPVSLESRSKASPSKSDLSNGPTSEVSKPAQEIKPKAKRKCLRGRLKWTESETDDLLSGVGIYGVGKWKKILTHPGFSFHPDRTMVDLKDRYRTCRMNEEKALERKIAEEGISRPETEASHSSNSSHVGGSSRRNSDVLRRDATVSEAQFSIMTSTLYEESLHSPRPRRSGGAKSWTEDEDSNLSRGYQKYGFQWTAIAKDPDFKLGHRTGAQVRDRFRMRYPEVYQSSVPLPLPSAPDLGSKKDVSKGDTGPNPSQLTFIMHDSDQDSPPTSSPERGRRHRPGLSFVRAPPEQSIPSLSSQGSSPSTPAIVLPERFSGLNVQALHDSDSQAIGIATSSPAASSDHENDAEHDAAPADADEVRHLSILGLLNEDNDHQRLPSFKYALDDWVDEPNDSSVTLPPLLSWDDLNNKPMFELE